MSTWSVRLDLQDGAGAFDLMNYTVDGKKIVRADGFEKTERLFKDTKPTIDTARFQVTMDSSLANSIITNDADILCEIDKDGAAWFTGIARPVTRYRITGVDGGDSIEFEIVDRGQRLKKEIASDITYVNYKVCDPANTGASIVHQLLVSAGYTLAEINITDTIDETVPEIGFAQKADYYETVASLLREYHYTFYHDESGDFRLYDWAPASITTSGSIGNSDIGPQLEIEVDDAQEDTIELEYQRSNTVPSVLMADKNFDNPWFIYDQSIHSTNQTWPSGSKTHRFDFDDGDSDARSIALSNVTYKYRVSENTNYADVRHKWYSEASPNPGVIVDIFTWSLEGANVRLTITDYEFGWWRRVTMFRVYADVLYYIGKQFIREALPDAKGTVLKEKAKWIYSETRAKQFARAMLDRLANSRRTFSFGSEEDYTLGGYYAFTNTETLITTTIRIVEKTDAGEQNPYVKRYVAEQCAELSTPAGLVTEEYFAVPATAAERDAGSRSAASGLDGDGRLMQPIDSNALDETFTPEADFGGLYHTHDKLGWWDGSAWTSYLASDGTFKFTGDGSNYIEWDGTALSIYGDMYLSGSSVIRGTLQVGDTLTVNGDINVAAGGSIYGTGYTLSASALTMTAGSIDINSGAFAVTTDGSVTATSGIVGGWGLGAAAFTGGDATLHSDGYLELGTLNNIVRLDATDATYRMWVGHATAASAPFRVTKAGAVTATSGAVGGWIIDALLKSAASGARIELNPAKNRISVFDTTAEKVAMGYLNGLAKYDGSGTWGSSDYGFWAAQGDQLRIDGSVEYVAGDWMVQNDAALRIYDATPQEVIRLGTDNGVRGLHFYDTGGNGKTASITPYYTSATIYGLTFDVARVGIGKDPSGAALDVSGSGIFSLDVDVGQSLAVQNFGRFYGTSAGTTRPNRATRVSQYTIDIQRNTVTPSSEIYAEPTLRFYYADNQALTMKRDGSGNLVIEDINQAELSFELTNATDTMWVTLDSSGDLNFLGKIKSYTADISGVVTVGGDIRVEVDHTPSIGYITAPFNNIYATTLYQGGEKVVESGSNLDGSWVKYADGTMICEGTDQGARNTTASNVLGTSTGTHYSREVPQTFPQAFVSTPLVQVTAEYVAGSYTGVMAFARDPSTTGFTIAHGYRGNDGNFKAAYRAMGSWF